MEKYERTTFFDGHRGSAGGQHGDAGAELCMITRTAMAAGRADGLAASVGMGIGGVTFTPPALIGLQTLMLNLPFLYLAFQIVGGSYLIYLGLRIWRGAPEALPETVTPRWPTRFP